MDKVCYVVLKDLHILIYGNFNDIFISIEIYKIAMYNFKWRRYTVVIVESYFLKRQTQFGAEYTFVFGVYSLVESWNLKIYDKIRILNMPTNTLMVIA